MLPTGCVPECRGCRHRELTETESLERKATFLRNKLPEWHELIQAIRSVHGHERLGYRTKVLLATDWKDQHWVFGMFCYDEILDVPHCPVHHQSVNRLVEVLKRELPPKSEFPVAFYAQSGRQLTLVLKSRIFPADNWLNDRICAALTEFGIDGLWLHLNLSAGHRVYLNSNWKLVWGKENSVDERGLVYGPVAFQQLIPKLYHHALDKTEAFFALAENSAVVDLYCGIGASMLRFLKSGAAVIGVELGGNAVSCARINAPQALVLRGKCSERIPQLTSWLYGRTDEQLCVFVNPPRTGVEPEVLEWLVNTAKPHKIAYLSCSIGTLVKNLNYLVQNNYSVVEITPYDFFPITHHQETLVFLQKMN